MSLCLTMILGIVSAAYAEEAAKVPSFSKTTNSIFIEGDKPWEEQLLLKEKQEKQEIQEKCLNKQKSIEAEKKRQAKLKALEEKRKREEEQRKLEEQKRQEEKWQYFEEKDYAVDQSSSGEEKAAALIEYAKDHLGVKYTWGGESWSGGVDCSGFTKLCYAKFGVSLPHYSGAQESVGTPVKSLLDARQGDIICYPGHVALYIGNGQIIHASNYNTGVIIGNANYRGYTTIRRIFN